MRRSTAGGLRSSKQGASCPRPRRSSSASTTSRRSSDIFVDTHLHLEELGDATKVVEQAVAAGVTRLIGVGVNLEQSTNAVSLGHAYQEVWAGVGHHPLEPSEPDFRALRQLATDEMVVVVGRSDSTSSMWAGRTTSCRSSDST